MTADDELEDALGRWLQQREDQPALLPGEFAQELAEPLRSAFLRELEELAEIDRATTLAPPRDLPQRFGDFRVLGLLGQGAMGAVYLAEQVSLGRRVALKVLHPQVAGDLHTAARFQREARTAASLAHPGIVPVFGFGEEQGTSWLAMGLIGGRSLQRLLQAWNEPRDIDHARAQALFGQPRTLAMAFADAADALDFAHRKNVVHRDLKPANLMYGDDGRLIVLDFGLASARGDDDSAVSLTRTGDFLGTPLYMAPEQATGADRAGPRSDVYALGAVLYECLCGRPPVPPGSLPQVLDHIRDRDADDPRVHRRDAPPELARIALMCLEKGPDRRYASAAALADDLRRYCDGQPVRARSPGPVARTLRRLRRRPAWTAALLLSLVAGGFALFAWRTGSENDRLAIEGETRAIQAALAASPEGITVFGGASREWYARLGLGDHLPVGESAPSAAATAALQRATALADRFPGHQGVRSLLARVLLDVGGDDRRTRTVLDQAASSPSAAPADLAMRATWLLRRGETAAAETAWRTIAVDSDDVELQFWHGIWQQTRQDYFAAIAAFDRALHGPGLPEELRYFALLHRGWCRTCPEVDLRRAAEDDLLQAAALRPQYGTARLLWAGLRCLDPDEDLARPVAAVTEVLTAVQMEPWVVTLVARVLLAFAEASALPGERPGLAAEFSPLAAIPLPEARRLALAGKALELLDLLRTRTPDAVEPRIHTIAALTMLGRHEDALALADELAVRLPAAHRALALMLRARVLAARGCLQQAHAAVDRALAADARYVDALRLRAELCARVGDLPGELAALEGAVTILAEVPQAPSVLPEAAFAQSWLQLRCANLLLLLDRPARALEVLAAQADSVLAGQFAPRWHCERAVLRVRAERRLGVNDAAATTAAMALLERLPATSPLRLLRTWLDERIAIPMPTSTAAMALRRGWLHPDSPVARTAVAAWPLLLAADVEPSIQDLTTALAPFVDAPADLDHLRLQGLLPLLRRVLPGDPAAADRWIALAQRAGADGDHSEARLLKAAALFTSGRAAAAATFLADTEHLHRDDLRGRWLQAVAALGAGDEDAARRALAASADRSLAAELLPHVQRRVAVPAAAAFGDRLHGLRDRPR
ncbi:MAG: protein kinase [Planctomycetes bacterium]|nr:protein kinase [Planctomycetota bacterium]